MGFSIVEEASIYGEVLVGAEATDCLAELRFRGIDLILPPRGVLALNCGEVAELLNMRARLHCRSCRRPAFAIWPRAVSCLMARICCHQAE